MPSLASMSIKVSMLKRSMHEVADARLGDAEKLGSLALLQPARRNRLLEAQHQFGADLEGQSLIRRGTKVAEHVTSRPGQLHFPHGSPIPFGALAAGAAGPSGAWRDRGHSAVSVASASRTREERTRRAARKIARISAEEVRVGRTGDGAPRE